MAGPRLPRRKEEGQLLRMTGRTAGVRLREGSWTGP